MKKVKRGSKLVSTGLAATRSHGKNGVVARPSHYQSLFDSASLSIIETDLAGHIIDCNPALARLLLGDEEDFKERRFVSLVSTAWHAKEESTRKEVIEHGIA